MLKACVRRQDHCMELATGSRVPSAVERHVCGSRCWAPAVATGDMDSEDSTQDVYWSQFSSQTTNPLWHRQGEGAGQTQRSFTSRQSTGIQSVAEKSQYAQPSKGSRVYSWGSHAELCHGERCHGAGLKAKLEMGRQVQFSPRDWHLDMCIWAGQDAPESQCAAAHAFPGSRSQMPCCLHWCGRSLADDWLL